MFDGFPALQLIHVLPILNDPKNSTLSDAQILPHFYLLSNLLAQYAKIVSISNKNLVWRKVSPIIVNFFAKIKAKFINVIQLYFGII